jgi:anti-anti-sigma factor
MEITHKEHDGIMIIAMNGQLNPTTVPEAEKTIDEILSGGADRLLFDFGQLTYLNSGGLRVILSTSKKIETVAGRMVLCAMQNCVKEIFEIVGFASFMPIEDSVESGLQTFK